MTNRQGMAHLKKFRFRLVLAYLPKPKHCTKGRCLSYCKNHYDYVGRSSMLKCSMLNVNEWSHETAGIGTFVTRITHSFVERFWCLSIHPSTSVTRFGKILPLWQHIKSLGQFLMVYLVFGIIFSILWQFLMLMGNFFAVYGWIFNNWYFNLVTLPSTHPSMVAHESGGDGGRFNSIWHQ